MEEKIVLAQQGDEVLKEQLVEMNIGLVWSLVHRFRQQRVAQEELYQVGCLGLVKAINNFDTSYNVKFSTYAVPIILGEIKRYFRDEGAIHVSRSMKENYLRIIKVRDHLVQELQREPTYQELSVHCELDVEDVFLAFEANQYVSSIDEPIYDSDGNAMTLEDRVTCEPRIDMTSLLALRKEIRELDNREQLFLWYRYYKEWNQDVIAREFGISQVQVSRMEKRILTYLQGKLNGK